MLLEVYPRAYPAAYCALGRKVGQVGQCVGRANVDTRDQSREYNQWVNPERSHLRQNSQRLRSIEIWRIAAVDTSPIRTDYSYYSMYMRYDDGFNESYKRMYLLIACAYLSEH